jgi:hypothetical protein
MSEAPARVGRREFGLASFGWRWAGVLLLVIVTYNPTRFCYFRWVYRSMGDEGGGFGPEHFVVGAVLVAGWAILIAATQRSLGPLGLLLAAAIIGGVIWWLTSLGLVSVASVSMLTWVILFCLSVLLAVGLSWSHVWRRLTGQYEVDDNDT